MSADKKNDARNRGETPRQPGESSLDGHLAEYLLSLSGAPDPELKELYGRLIRATRNGHVCLNLTAAEAKQTARHDVVGDGTTPTPLVLRERRLYMYRYFDYERTLAAAINGRLAVTEIGAGTSDEQVADMLERLFPAVEETDRQKQAAELALSRRFLVISGGPGTGKTTTVVKILALLLKKDPSLRIALTTPTGKAALRLSTSIQNAQVDAPPEIQALIPREATTLHRLLGARRFSPYFKHDAANPVPLDLLVMDEASMTDLPLFAKTMDALPPDARVILLGDRNQLASVEAGSVFGDICSVSGQEAKQARRSIVELNRNYRFGDHSAVARLSRAVNAGDMNGILEVLEDPNQDQVRWVREPERLEQSLTEAVLTGYGDFARARNPADCLAAFENFRVLCAHRRGRRGVPALNRFILHALSAAGLLRPREGRSSRDPLPVMITRNDYRLELYNGDTGVLLHDENEEARVHFPGEEDLTRMYHPERLPDSELSFAMTVHKSQGSEFDAVVLILPEAASPVLTRELLYTAITRSRGSFLLLGEEPVLRAAATARIDRASGLTDQLI